MQEMKKKPQPLRNVSSFNLNRLDKMNVKIEYRYIPRTFEEAQNEPVFSSDIFKSMFEGDNDFTTLFENKKELENNPI